VPGCLALISRYCCMSGVATGLATPYLSATNPSMCLAFSFTSS